MSSRLAARRSAKSADAAIAAQHYDFAARADASCASGLDLSVRPHLW